MEMQWQNGWHIFGLQIERFGFEPWPESLCHVFGQDTSLSQCLSPPRNIKLGNSEFVGKCNRKAGSFTSRGLASH